MGPEAIILGVFFFMMGACIGSFLNVCIVRMPHEQSIVFPGSHCPKCQKAISWYDNIPMFSYLILRGKCRYCQASFSFRYFFVELLTAAVFVAYYIYFGLDWLLLPYLVMTCGFIVATFVDFGHRIIPDEISVGGVCAGLFLSLLIPAMHVTASPHDSVWITHAKSFGFSLFGVLVGGGSLYLMAIIGDFIFKKESMGGGDIKLLAMIGAFLGWPAAVLSIFLGSFFGAVYGLAEKIRTGDTTIAFGPFLIIGALLCLFWGDHIVHIILYGF